MRLRLVNTGTVREATVDLRDLVVVMGYNGSGKSTIATVLYAAVKSASRGRRRGPVAGSQRSIRASRAIRSQGREFRREANRILESAPELDYDEFANRIVDAAGLIYRSILQEFGAALAHEIAAGFGCSVEDLPTRNVQGKRLPMRIIVTSENPQWAVTLRVRRKDVFVEAEVQSEITLSDIDNDDYISYLAERVSTSKIPLSSFISAKILDYVFADIPPAAHFLPAARAGLLQSHRLVAATMVQQSPFIGISDQIALPSLSGVVADFVAEILLGERRSDRAFTQLARKLEQTVLGGRVERLGSTSEYPEIQYSDRTGDYPLHRTSSMVSELATLVLLLKSHVSSGELLIVEEPESHLHPRAQAQLAGVLYEASQKGLKVMLTTHSDYFVSELNIKISEEGSTRSSGISNGRVVAYWANRIPDDGTRLEKLPVDPLDGISQMSFTEVAEAQYGRQVQLQTNAAKKAEE
ncbi:AAA family ATPase [Nocardia wallacei]|nr:AAA family ATPase [Nocardia wallacei]